MFHSKLGLFVISLALVVILSLSLVLFIYTETNRVEGQLETVKSREILIALENGTLSTMGELVVPTGGKGPFPAVLLIPGSGIADRNEYLPPEVSRVDGGSKPFWQIAEYLAERGFVVLKYDKRGVGENATVINASLLGNATVHTLQRDAESALKVLLQQPEVDKTNITVLGHSEGAVVAPRLAIFGEYGDSIKNVIMLGASAQTLYDLVVQKANQKLFDAHNLWDADKDGLLSIEEVIIFPDTQLTIPDPSTNNSDNNDNNISGSNLSSYKNLNFSYTKPQQWYPGIDINNDNFIDIENEMVPFVQMLLSQIDSDPWYISHKEINPTVNITGNLTHKDILIMQGEEDVQTTLEQAFVLEQKLTEIRHADHTLKTYPGLGHTFFPQQGPNELLGPIQDYVLADLHTWLKDPDRDR
ncbi:alpha/beta hydrolase family protein [Candidatus Nitrosocosmicus sp. T]